MPDWRAGRCPREASRVGTAVPEAEELDEAPQAARSAAAGPVVLPLHARRAAAGGDARGVGLPPLPSLGASDADGVRRRAGARQGAVRRRAAGRPGGRHRPAVRRPSRADHGSRDGGGRHRPAHRLHHQCGQALQVRAARQAAHPQDARGARDPGLPLLAGRRTGAAAAEAGGGDGRHGGARGARAAPSPSRASAGGRSRLPDGQTAFVTVHPSFLLRVPGRRCKGAGVPRLRRRLDGRWLALVG